MQKIKMNFLFIAIHIFSFTQVSAQSQPAFTQSLLPGPKTMQILSPTAQIFADASLRKQLIPLFNGQYHAQAIVNETFLLDNSDFIVSSFIDPENPNYRIAHLTFTADNWNQIIEHSGLIYLDVSSRFCTCLYILIISVALKSGFRSTKIRLCIGIWVTSSGILNFSLDKE
jgi:hypothetical protein